MWQYNGYGIAFNSKGEFTHSSGQSYAKNIIIFGVNLSGSRHSSNKTQNILVLEKDFIQKINNTTIYAEKMYSPNFTLDDKILCLSLYYSDNSYLFVNGKEVCKFKTKNSELKKYNLCLESISKDYDKKDVSDVGLNGYVYDFSFDSSPITTDKIHDIHRYLMKKTILYKMFSIIKKILAIIFLVSNVNSLKCISMKKLRMQNKRSKNK